MMRRAAFTLIELIFVIVIMGILSKFGVEFLLQAYYTFIYSKINHELQSRSELAVQTIANRLQYRIPQSTIKRNQRTNHFTLAPEWVANPDEYNILEWIGYDIDGFRGGSNGQPLWSGIIDLNDTLTTAAKLFSPDTNTTAINNLIDALSDSTIADAALFFNSADYDEDGFGWVGGAVLNDHTRAMHPVNALSANEFSSSIPGVDFSSMRVYNRYFLAWTAYAVVHDAENAKLWLHYDYQPWRKENYNSNTAKKRLLMDNVDTFRIRPSPDGTLFNIIVCAESKLIVGTMEEHSLCKEKVIF